MAPITLDPTLQKRLEQVAHDTGQPAEEIVREGVRAHLEALEREKLAAEGEAYERLHPQLKEEYLHQFGALHNGEVVDADPDLEALYDRVVARWGATTLLIRQVRETAEEIFHFHSVRLHDHR